MEFNEVLARRYSCRSYSDRPVEREKIDICMEAGRQSPSGCNTQRWMFIAVDDPEKRAVIAEAMTAPPEIGINRFGHDIPAFIVVLNHPFRRELNEKQKLIIGQFDHSMIDIGIAAQQICLTATDQGLGNIMIGWFNQEPIKAALNIPEDIDIALLIGVGYPKDDRIKRPSRYSPEQVYSWNGYTKAE